MTPTELIAVELFGWKQSEGVGEWKPSVCGYSTGKWCRVIIGDALYTRQKGATTYAEWPDPTDYNWIRRMEDALAERGLLLPYYFELQTDDCKWPEALVATAEQRVEAAVKVLEAHK